MTAEPHYWVEQWPLYRGSTGNFYIQTDVWTGDQVVPLDKRRWFKTFDAAQARADHLNRRHDRPAVTR